MMKHPAVERMEERLGALLEEELGLCKTALEQQAVIEMAIRLCMGAWTIRYREAPPDVQERCINALTAYNGFVVNTFRLALQSEKKGLRQ